MPSLKPVFEFELLYDLDYAIFELAKEKFSGSDYMDPVVMSLNPIDARIVLLARENKSVFSCLLLEDHADSAVSLEEEFFERYIEDIYKNEIETTSVFKLFNSFLNVDDSVITPKILCKNLYQYEIVDKLFGDIYVDLDLEVREYDSMYLKYGDTYSLLKNEPSNRTIYLANYGFNLDIYDKEEFFPKQELYDKITIANNDIMLIDVYSDIVKPF